MSASHRLHDPNLPDPAAPDGPLGAGDGNAIAAATRRADRHIAELRRILARFGTHKQLAEGASLFDSRDTSRHVYIVKSGLIDICLPEDSSRRAIASFHPGACFLFDFGGYRVAAIAAAEDSEMIDIPFSRLRRLCRQEMDLRLLLRQCHAFDLKSFLDLCYPARNRVRLAAAATNGEPPRPEADTGRASGIGHEAGERFLFPLAADGRSAASRRRHRQVLRRTRGRHASANGSPDAES